MAAGNHGDVPGCARLAAEVGRELSRQPLGNYPPTVVWGVGERRVSLFSFFPSVSYL